MPSYTFEGKAPQIHEKAFVHPEAVVIGEVRVEENCYVGAGAVLRGDIGSITVGEGSNVQENCVFHTFPDQSVVLHPNAHIGHGCILHGCEIFSKVLVGMGSIIGDGVVIRSFCLIGAGSFIPFDMEIPSESVVVGSPAKVIKKISSKQMAQIETSLGIYQELARRYLVSFEALDE